MTIDGSGNAQFHIDINMVVAVAGTNVTGNIKGEVAATLRISNPGDFSQAVLDHQQVSSMVVEVQGRTIDISGDVQNLLGRGVAEPITLMCSGDTLIYGWTVPSIGPNAITFQRQY